MHHYLPHARTADLVVQDLDNEVLVFDLATNKAFCLNETSGFIWRASDGSKTVAEIGEDLRRKTKSDVNDEMVWLAIDQLSQSKLLLKSAPRKFTATTRRNAIKKIGLGSMIALPLVSSLVAPSAVSAQSLAPDGTVVGTVTIPGPGCPNFASRDALCDATYASQCASMNTDPSACSPTTGPGPYTVVCTCAP